MKSLRRKFVKFIILLLEKIVLYKSLSINVTEEIAVQTKNGIIKFICPNYLTKWRAQTFHEKEPETLEWIDSFNSNDCLWDIGANVGLYSLYAASRGMNVVSFEPALSNSYLFSKNIEVNNFSQKIKLFGIALSDSTEVNTFYMSETTIGTALHGFGEKSTLCKKEESELYQQAMLGFSIDSFLEHFKVPYPNHIKIDVDGIEKKIINGASKTFKDERLKSVMIEIDLESEFPEIRDLMEKCGLKFTEKKHAEVFDNGDYSGVYNYFFKRDI